MSDLSKIELPQGTLDLLILRLLRSGEMHGWGIAQKLALIFMGCINSAPGGRNDPARLSAAWTPPALPEPVTLLSAPEPVISPPPEPEPSLANRRERARYLRVIHGAENEY